ncbi:MAG: PAS domain S-box protein [Methanomicrobiaceae archaeon]|nr:PAS domain S-box protein [Methanomicrobiaceae archaeon]
MVGLNISKKSVNIEALNAEIINFLLLRLLQSDPDEPPGRVGGHPALPSGYGKQVPQAVKLPRAAEKPAGRDLDWRAVANGIGDAVFLSRPDGRIIDVNDAAARLFCVPRAEIQDTYMLSDFFCAPGSIEELLATAEGNRLHYIPGTARCPKDGSEFPCEICPRRFTSGGLEIMLTTVRDTGERQQAGLPESEGRYRRLAESTEDVLYSADQDGIIMFIGPQVRRYGFEPEEIVSRHFTDFIHEADRDRVRAEFRTSLLTGKTSTIEFRIRDAAGNIIWVEENHGMRVIDGGAGVEITGVLRDNTERRLNEKMLQQANTKLDLLSSVTRHDILNQLTILLGNNAIAAERTSDPALLEYLRRQEQAARNILDQIEFTRVYQELGVNDPKWQNIEETIARAVPCLKRDRVSCTADLEGLEIHADPLLEKVFFNLVDNAVRHGETVTKIRFGMRAADGGIVIVCEDDGMGIPELQKESIFKRGVGRNTGLGLFLVREILTITGIEIRETGEYGRGARFEIHVPQGRYRIRQKSLGDAHISHVAG